MVAGSAPTLAPPPAVESPPPPGERSPVGALVALAATVVLLVAGAVVLVRATAVDNVALPASTSVTASGTQPASTAGSSAPTSAPPISNPPPLASPITPTGNAGFDASVTEVARFVEQTRGHPFKTPVKITLADNATFERALSTSFEQDIPELRKMEVAYKALGLVPANSDLVKIARTEDLATTAGFYDPKSKELLVRGGDLTPTTRTTLAHELTHALDDQWFSLDAALDETDDEAAFAFRSLVEGSSTRVEAMWATSRSPQEQADEKAEAERQGQRLADNPEFAALPPEVVQVVESPYSLGYQFVEGLITNGGLDALDAAYASPPSSSEQLMHPARYRDGDQPQRVEVPPADGPQVDEGVLGELELAGVMSIGLAPSQARAAAEGWAGDCYVVWSTPNGRSCLRADVVMHNPADKTELATALGQWKTQHPNATIEERDDRTVRFTSCS